MRAATPAPLDVLAQLLRRHLWVAFTLIVLLGGVAIAMIAFPHSQISARATQLFALLPIVMAIAFAALKGSAKGVSMDPASPAMKTIRNDELRQASLSRSYRNGLLAVLMLQAPLALLLTWASHENPVALMAGVTVITGMAVFLASMLYYDR
jgi:RsiW-degrading membrane proteinase PrsW (M82 family)